MEKRRINRENGKEQMERKEVTEDINRKQDMDQDGGEERKRIKEVGSEKHEKQRKMRARKRLEYIKLFPKYLMGLLLLVGLVGGTDGSCPFSCSCSGNYLRVECLNASLEVNI